MHKLTLTIIVFLGNKFNELLFTRRLMHWGRVVRFDLTCLLAAHHAIKIFQS